MQRFIKMMFCLGLLFFFHGLTLHNTMQAQPTTDAITLPVIFGENVGQWDRNVLFGGILSPIRFLHNRVEWRNIPRRLIPQRSALEASHDVGAAPNSVQFNHPSPNMTVRGWQEADGAFHCYIGRDSTTWRPNEKILRGIEYHNVWDSVDVIYSGSESGGITQTIRLRPGAQPSQVGIFTNSEKMMFGEHTKTRSTAVNTFQTINMVMDVVPDTTEYSTYIGGSGYDEIRCIRQYQDGTTYIAGVTRSKDLPFFMPSWGVHDAFVMRLGCDGRTVLWSTIYASPTEPTSFYRAVPSMVMGLRKDGHVFVGCVTAGIDWSKDLYPITPNALEKPTAFGFTRWANVLLEIDAGGLLRFASLFGMGAPGEAGKDVATPITNIVFDTSGNVLMSGSYFNTGGFKYLTPGTINSFSGNVGTYLVKFTPTMDSLVWGAKTSDIVSESDALGIDSQNHPIIAGTLNNHIQIPVVNAFQPGIGRMFIQKLNANASAYIYSTYFGGPDSMHKSNDFISKVLHVGSDDKTYLVGTTSYPLFPIVNSLRQNMGRYDAFVAVVSDSGRLLRSCVIGGSWDDHYSNADVDTKGNIYLFGVTHSGNYPLVSSWLTMPDTVNTTISEACLTVLAANSDSLLFSTIWPATNMDIYVGQSQQTRLLELTKSGYAHFGGMTILPMPAFHGLRDALFCNDEDKCYDGYLVRMYLPFAGQNFVHGLFSGSDSVRFETTQGILSGSRFPITVRMENTSSKDTAWDVNAAIVLPGGVVLDPPGQSLSMLRPGPMLPGEKSSFVWNVRIVSHDPKTTSYHFPITIYQGYDINAACERPFTRGSVDVTVHRYASPLPAFDCSLTVVDSLVADLDADSLTGNPVSVLCRIKNNGINRAYVQSLVLRLAKSSPAFPLGLCSPAYDSIRPGGMLAPGEEMVRTWLVRASNLPDVRTIQMQAILVDTFGVHLPSCIGSLRIPALRGVDCAIAAVDTFRYGASSYQPSPGMLDVELSSRLDTALANLVAVIDLAHARHVQTVTGESYTHSVAPIPSHGVMGTRWCLEVIPHPPRPVDDSIIVRYSAPGWNGERSCMHIVHIIPPTQSVTCALTLPDVTIMPDGRFAPDTIALQWTLSNAGDIPSPAGSARLTLSADSAACIDPFVLPIPALAAKQQTTLTWRLVPRTSAFNRSVGISVAARDSAGRAFADCHARLELPRVFPAVECSLSAPDSLRYLRSSDAYLPDPFTASVSVHNRVDTVDVVDVGIDLSAAPHLGLAAGETGVAALGALAAHDTASAAFRVTVRQAPDVASTERIRTAVTARFGEATIDSECSASIAMEARPKIFTAECYTMGHDTTWADPGNEDMIPHPLQMRLGIINTGNEPIENCAAAIIIPNGYILSQPPDSIQRYASIAPGDTGRREWLMEVNRVNTVPGVSEVRWTWGNGTLSGSCTRSAVLVQGSPVGITLSRWRLLFRAQRNDPAPAAQTVSVWTGGNVPFTWRAASDAWWLDATPNLLSGSKTIQIGPTTTALADGWYEGMVRIVTGEFARPTPIEVGYEIYTTADAETPPQPGGPALWCLPNPSRPGATVQVRYVQRAPGPVRLGLVDALGREAAALQPGSSEAGEHAVTLALPASMSAGAYFLVLEAAEGRVVKGMMVIR